MDRVVDEEEEGVRVADGGCRFSRTPVSRLTKPPRQATPQYSTTTAYMMNPLVIFQSLNHFPVCDDPQCILYCAVDISVSYYNNNNYTPHTTNEFSNTMTKD